MIMPDINKLGCLFSVKMFTPVASYSHVLVPG
jgi:hypothetical protein